MSGARSARERLVGPVQNGADADSAKPSAPRERINNVLRPTHGARRRSHLLDDLLEVFLVVVDGLVLPHRSP
jgi:hypothetical protein